MYTSNSRNSTDEQASQDADAAASQLIDSFFLPGGLFDPEDVSNTALSSGNNDVMLSNVYDSSGNESVPQTRDNNNSRLDPFKRPSSIEYGNIFPHIPTSVSGGSSVHNLTHKLHSSDNSTATPAAGVGALHPNNDQVIVGGGTSRGRQVFDFHPSVESTGQDSMSKISSPKLGPKFDQDVDLGMFPASRSTTAIDYDRSTNFHITPAGSKQSYQNAENKSNSYGWYDQQSSNASEVDRIQYSSYATNQPSKEFSSFFGNAIRSNISSSSQNQPVPPSSEYQESKLNSNPWSNDDLMTLPTNVANQFNFMPSDDKKSSSDNRSDYIQEYSEYSSHSHSKMPFTSKTANTHRVPPGFVASSSTSTNSQIHSTEPNTNRQNVSASQMHSMKNSFNQQERRMNYRTIASRNNAVSYDTAISSQKQPQQQRRQGQHISANYNENNAVPSYREQQHPSSSQLRPSKVQYNNSSPIRKKSSAAVQAALQQEVDYDFRSQSSRDVPSTIYVEDDVISNSEDTLTVCADSVTVTSVPQNRSERFDMDVVEETSMTEHKKAKTKRHKKKKHKKKHTIQESVKSNDNESSGDEDNEMEVNERNNSEIDEIQHDYRHQQEEPKLTRRNINQNTSRASAATTAMSSTITHHGHKATTKKKGKPPKEMIPDKSFLEVILTKLRHVLPMIANLCVHITKSSVQFAKVMSKKCVGLLPGKDKFWFLFPMTCIISDFFFLMCALFTKVVGKSLYVTIILHKLAFLELLDSDSAAMCYSVIYFYPSIIRQLTFDLPFAYQEYVPGLLRWLFVHTYLLRPIKMRDTYIYKVKQALTKKNESPNRILNRLFPPRVNVTTEKTRVVYSDRLTMANYILSILRKVAPLIIMLETNIHRDGFLLYLTNTERILFGYGLSVLRTGYLFSPLIWISWTIQLTIIMFVSLTNSSILDHCLLLLGLISIRMSHYNVALEDLEGSNAPHCNSTSSRRQNASNIAKYIQKKSLDN